MPILLLIVVLAGLALTTACGVMASDKRGGGCRASDPMAVESWPPGSF